MIILITEDYSKGVLQSVLELINDIRPGCTYSYNADDKEADVLIRNYREEGLADAVEEIAESTQKLVIGISEDICISETSVGFSAGLTDVREHIRTDVGRYW